MLLSYPSIGLGKIEMTQDRNHKASTRNENYLVCCLRGATAYLVPLGSSNTDPHLQLPCSTSLRVIYYPHDIDTVATPVQQVQGFTAGNLVHRHGIAGTATQQSTPVLVYAWPGGLIDLYSCQLRKKPACPRSIYSTLIENGSAEMLRSLLFSFPTREELRENGPVWQAAFDEVSAHAKSSDIEQDKPSLSLEEICSNRFAAFRTLLLELAEA